MRIILEEKSQAIVDKLNERSRVWQGHCDRWIAEIKLNYPDQWTQMVEDSMRKDLNKEAADEIVKMHEKYEMSNAIMSSFFNISRKTEKDIEPVLMDGLKGYLRTSVNGGMDHELANAVEAVLADYIRLYAGKALVPVLRSIASESADQLIESEAFLRS